MAFVIKFIKGVRNHWKKSTFATCALAYGANYTKESYQIQQLMRKYCDEARKYGLEPVLNTENPRKVIVILNPTANRRKSVKQFEQYCAPILHLAGICVDVVHTKTEGHARTLIEELKDNVDAIVIAGGDGTISECVTGLLRRTDNSNSLSSCSIGVLPLGKTNAFAQILFANNESNKKIKNIQRLADASMAIVRQHTRRTDIMKIELLPELHTDKYDRSSELVEENADISDFDEKYEETIVNKPVYALSGLQWGSYRDAHSRSDKYWYFGPLRSYVTYVFNGLKANLNWNCNANITYSPPCLGCSNCIGELEFLNKTKDTINQNNNNRWWGTFVSNKSKSVIDAEEWNRTYQQRNTVNENCSNIQSKCISTSDLCLTICDENLKSSEAENDRVPQLQLNLGPEASNISYVDFIEQGWKAEKGEKRNIHETLRLRRIELIPETNNSQHELFYSIDSEDYEVKPIRITLLPKVLKVFCN